MKKLIKKLEVGLIMLCLTVLTVLCPVDELGISACAADADLSLSISIMAVYDANGEAIFMGPAFGMIMNGEPVVISGVIGSEVENNMASAKFASGNNVGYDLEFLAQSDEFGISMWGVKSSVSGDSSFLETDYPL